MESRYSTAEWIELSGLPLHLNDRVRAGAWPVFKSIVELDCKRNSKPDAVEMTLGELGARCGLDWEKVAKIAESLRKKKYILAFVPDNPDEPGLFQIKLPVETPVSPEEVAIASTDPHMRDPGSFRYTSKPTETPEEIEKVQRVVDLYLNTLSQKMNSFIVEQIEILAQRFPYEAIQKTIERAARHEIRNIGWVAKELIRDTSRPKQKSKSKTGTQENFS